MQCPLFGAGPGTASRPCGIPPGTGYGPGRPPLSTSPRSAAYRAGRPGEWVDPPNQSASVMVTESMVTFSDGVPDRLPIASIRGMTSRPLITLPNSE